VPRDWGAAGWKCLISSPAHAPCMGSAQSRDTLYRIVNIVSNLKRVKENYIRKLYKKIYTTLLYL